VSVNGALEGESGRLNKQVSVGRVKLTFERPGFTSRDTIVVVQPGAQLKLTFTLNKIP